MNVSTGQPRHFGLVARYHAKYSIRSGSAIVFAFITLVTGLLIANTFISSLETLQRSYEKQYGKSVSQEEVLGDLMRDLGTPAALWALNKDQKFADFLLQKNPALLSVTYLFVLFSVPFLVPLGAFNLYAGDIQSRGLRFLLTRADRTTIFLGRFIGTYLFTCAVLLLVVSTISLYTILKIDLYGWKETVGITLSTAGALLLLALPYVALSAWVSASVASPFLSLLIVNLVVSLVPLFGFMASATWKPVGVLSWLIPWGLKFNMLHPEMGVRLLSAGGCLLYTGIFLALGLYTFNKRDL